MPKKKKASELPPLPGASPPGSARSARTLYARGLGDSQRRVFWDPDLTKASTGEGPSQSEPSTAASLGVLRDDARSISQQFDSSLQAASAFSVAPDSSNNAEDWAVQNPKDIIMEVVQCVHERKPWRPKLDDSILNQKHNERQDRQDRGFHIILPDNRVRVMEDELSFRVRCSLLDIDPSEAEQPAPPSRSDKSKAKNSRMRQNPWYLKPGRWYSPSEKLKLENNEEDRNDFPYANVILNLQEEPIREGEKKVEKPPLTTFQKENLDMYKAYMKGLRLPHFLQ